MYCAHCTVARGIHWTQGYDQVEGLYMKRSFFEKPDKSTLPDFEKKMNGVAYYAFGQHLFCLRNFTGNTLLNR